jgi:hypothetical protein
MKTEKYKIFKKWYKANKKSFYSGQLNEKEIAFAAFLAGIESNKSLKN